VGLISCSANVSPFDGSEAQMILRVSFANRLLEFLEPTRDEGQPSFTFILRNDLNFYSKYRLILQTEVPFPPSTTPKFNQKTCGTVKKKTITIREALIFYGISGLFSVFDHVPIIQELLFLMKKECQAEINTFLHKLEKLEKIEPLCKSKL
jgi:hypothetical protein